MKIVDHKIDAELARPISAPSAGEMNEALHEQLQADTVADLDSWAEQEQAASYIAAAQARAPFIQQILFIRNKKDWKHYYSMPANVGIQNVPRLVDEMIREGAEIADIEIVFENKEYR